MREKVKCLVWDLDNTLWNGILTENEDVVLMPNVIEIIKELDARGILQSISSKNNHEDAAKKLKEFGLYEYFLYPEINWNAKSNSLGQIIKNLNIGANTFAFIDDSPFEIDEVNSVYGDEILLLDASKYTDILDMPDFNPKFITSDSANRRNMYMQEIVRKKIEDEFVGPNESFLKDLNMSFLISEAKEKDLERVEELTVRTNQLNSTGITYNHTDLLELMDSKDHKVFVCELTDKFGSYGKIGIALISLNDTSWCINLLLMSCRVISRGVGTVLLNFIIGQANEANVELLADFIRTDRNRMMYLTYKLAGFKEQMEGDPKKLFLESKKIKAYKSPEYLEFIYNK